MDVDSSEMVYLAMPKSNPKQKGAVRKAVPNDALFRLGKKIEAELQIQPVPEHIDPVTGRVELRRQFSP